MGQAALLDASDELEIEEVNAKAKAAGHGQACDNETGPAKSSDVLLNSTVLRRVDFNDSLFLLRVRPDNGVPQFQAGQYITIALPGSAARPDGFPPDPDQPPADRLIKRAYSIASSPSDNDGLEFYIALVREGLLTPRLWLLNEGDRLSVGTKVVGKFTLSGVPSSAHLVLLATGTGIAPYISMLRTPAVWTEGRVVTILHGVRYTRDLSYHSELQELETRHHGRLRYIPVVSREEPPEGGYRGYIQRILLGAGIELLPNREHVFACGNPAMIAEVESNLLNQGFTLHGGKQLGNLHIEKYW